MDNLKSHGNNNENKMTIQDVRNVLYSKEFWEAQRSYIGAKRNMDMAMREARFNLERASFIDHDVKNMYGNSVDPKTPSKWKSSNSLENKSNFNRSNSIQGSMSGWNQGQLGSPNTLPARSNSICAPSMHQMPGSNYGNIGFAGGGGVNGNHFNHRYGVPMVGNKSIITPARRTSSVELNGNGSTATGMRNGRPQFYIVGRTVNSEPPKK